MSVSLSILRRLGSAAKTSFAIIGLGTSAYAAKELRGITNAKSGDVKKKNILVLPFHRMKIVEQKNPSLSTLVDKLSSKEDGIMEVEIRELVDVIHAAASDPDVVAIHGTFGHGFGFQCGGYAHVEEIRNAIRFFNESHRRHYEGKGSPENGNNNTCENTNSIKKSSYAFADSFDNPTDPGNKEYFLASAFSQVNMQPRGNMQLFGVSMTGVFLADALKKYGIKAHVFKHGQYKNAPNSITESGYTKAHRENTKAILGSINESVYEMISHSRNFSMAFDNSVWKAVHGYGTMTADNAQEIKLIDYLPKVNPVFDLVRMNACKSEDETQSETLREKWTSLLLNDDNFKADKMVSLSDYSAQLKEKKRYQRRRADIYDKVNYAVTRSTAFESILSILGYEAPYYNFDKMEVDKVFGKGTKDKVAVIHVTGGIDDKVAQKVIRALKQVKKDDNVKCVVLRVDSPGGGVTASETLLEECKDLGKPVVCSFSNLAASGGYYISAFSDRIFAQRTTLTGSIGVFGVKLDASEAARRHGVEFDCISSGDHAQTFSLFHPLNDATRANLTRNMDRVYQYFKQLVSEGRNIPLSEVETLAQGRVWTGEQAKEINLIDEFGGINRAISYAIAKYTSGVAEVEVFPTPPSLKEKLAKVSQMDMVHVSDAGSMSSGLILKTVLEGTLVTPCSVLLTMDESSAVKIIIKDVCERLQ